MPASLTIGALGSGNGVPSVADPDVVTVAVVVGGVLVSPWQRVPQVKMTKAVDVNTSHVIRFIVIVP